MFFSRMSYTWGAMGASWRVLKQDKELLVFPLISGIVCLMVMASFAVPLWMADAWMPPGQDAPIQQQVIFWGLMFLYYFASFSVITFFNAAIIGAAVIRLSGGDPTIGDGLRSATSRLPQILGWALVAATVGLILRVIEQYSERAGQFVAAILGTAWAVTTFLVVPVLVVEGVGPIDAFKNSTKMLRRTWGDQLMGNFGFVLMVPGIAVVFAGFALGGGAIGFAVAIPAVIYLLCLGLVQSALQAIFQAAVYVYAARGEVPSAFEGGMLEGAMGQR